LMGLSGWAWGSSERCWLPKRRFVSSIIFPLLQEANKIVE
jgi:hypothetical protein